MKIKLLLSASILLSLLTNSVIADTLNVAVASNFTHAVNELEKDFKLHSKHELRISSASTGKLYTQIINGAPFDVFMAADEDTPNKLIKNGEGSAKMSGVYAQGKLTLLSNIKTDGQCENVLTEPALKKLAIANPKTAPYGVASQQVLEKMGLWDSISPKLVMGENIAQTLYFVTSGNASAGFVASSLLKQDTQIKSSCEWEVPGDMHNPIRQKMTVLKKAENKTAAIAFWQYMQSDDAKKIITENGYDSL